MPSFTLPDGPAALAAVEWPEVAALYDALADRPLPNDEAVAVWLDDWSRFEAMLGEAGSRAMIRYTVNTKDQEAEKSHLRFSTDILPKAEERSVQLRERLVATGYSAPELETTLRAFRTSIEIFREANVPLQSALEEHGTTYQRITGGMTARWEGRDLPLPQVAPFLKDPDRGVREAAFRASVAPYVGARDTLAALFDTMHGLRQQVARNAGFPSYREYAFAAKLRFDYTPADCERFHDAVEEHVMPAYARLMQRRREALRVASLRPWDIAVDIYGAEPLRPFAGGAELATRTRDVVARVDPRFGRDFSTMLEEGLLDLESRDGKAPGGYCDTLHWSGRPFIFMNAVGIVDDVNTLLHEAGHAFHAFLAHHHPLVWQRQPGSEACELASMSMELLAAPELRRPPGFFSPMEHRRARLEHLEDVITVLAHVASVDAFQHWIYTDPSGADAGARDLAWLRLRARFDVGTDWSGLDRERLARWYRQLHIFLYPFYYIEYGIAQLGALQVWRNSRRDHAAAVERYRAALALGATRPLPEIYAAAGARLAFDGAIIAELVAEVEGEIDRLRNQVPEAA